MLKLVVVMVVVVVILVAVVTAVAGRGDGEGPEDGEVGAVLVSRGLDVARHEGDEHALHLSAQRPRDLSHFAKFQATRALVRSNLGGA